jgi:hypothetical protein
MRLGLLLPLLLAAPGCQTGSDECATDGDCGGGECTRTGACVASGTALRVVVRWTVGGVAPTPSQPDACTPLGELEVDFHDPGGDPEEYRPVPCALGQVVYDKMPPRFESVEVLAYDASGDVVDRAEAPLEPSGETSVLVDLDPRSRRP